MSLRLLKFTTSDAEFLLPQFMGAEGEDDVTEDDDIETDDDDNDDEDGDSKDSKKKTDSDGSDDELEKLRRRMKAADRRASAAEQKVKEFENKDKDQLEVAAERIKELESALSEKDNVLRKQGLENAFYASNTVTWHNPSLALKELDLEDVQDDETGEIDRAALKRSIEKLAKAQPYLVKSDADSNSKDKPKGKSGSNPGGSPQGNNGGKDADRAALERKYPALRK